MKTPQIVTAQEWQAARERLLVQQFLAALARDWDSPLDALKKHLDQGA